MALGDLKPVGLPRKNFFNLASAENMEIPTSSTRNSVPVILGPYLLTAIFTRGPNLERPTTTTTIRTTTIAPRPINIHFFIIFSPFKFGEDVSGSCLLPGKLGTKEGSVNMSGEENQISATPMCR